MAAHIDRGQKNIAEEIEARKTPFVLLFLALFTVAVSLLAWFDLMPEIGGHARNPLATQPPQPSATSSGVQAIGEYPDRIIIDKISLDVSISNPTATSTEVLDQALLSGGVRYPSSALLGVNGTVLLFGHSSYLPIVHNQAYKAFDGIQNLQKGDEIVIFSATKEYRFRTVSVRKVNVDDAQANTIPLPADAQHLVLVTCNSFASKADRFVLVADLVL